MRSERPEDHEAPEPDEAETAQRQRPSLALQLATYSGPAAALGLILLVGGLLALIGGAIMLFVGLIAALVGD